MKNEKWFGLELSQVEKKLKTNAASGLSRKAARSRVNRNAGSLFNTPCKPSYRLFIELLADFSLIILLVAAAVSVCFEEGRRQASMVLVLCGINLIVSWFLYYRSQRTVESLSSFFYPMARVVRGGKLYMVDFRSVVPGDVILLEAGDILCCDARLVSSDQLRVRMRVDRTKYTLLEKNAGSRVDMRETQAVEMTNMVHAGSIIEHGSARAIVTAVGRYTYLGAMTGGLTLPISSKVPKTVENLRTQSAKINLIFLICVLPFTMISLLISHLSGGTVLLSSAFLTALSLVATTMSLLVCTLSRLFYVQKLRFLVSNEHPSVLKSVEALDKLASADYVFVMDGSALTDGVQHFYAAVCADGEVRNTSAMSQTSKRLSELVSLYHTAATSMLTTGVSNAGNYSTAMKEFIAKSGVDEDALKIRCTTLSYSPASVTDPFERVYCNDQGAPVWIGVSVNPVALSSCNSVMIGGVEQKLSEEGRRNLESMWQKYVENLCTPLIFTVSGENGQGSCFVGFLIVREGVDPNWKATLAGLEQFGCRAIFFGRNSDSAPGIPKHMQVGCASKNDFIKNKLPFTYHFGKFRTYLDFDNEDILGLIQFIHRQDQRVLVLGFTDDALDIAACSDGFISCAPIHTRTTGYFDEEIRSRELSGQHYSLSCTQTVKEKADCIIPRPKNGKGGLASLYFAVSQIKTAHQNLSAFLNYMISVMIVRLIIVGVPMILGHAVLDARHVLLCSCILDLFAFLAFIGNKDYRKKELPKNYCNAKKVSDYFRGDKALLISSILSGATAVLLPELLGALNIAGKYHEKAELSFTAMILLHLVALFTVFYRGRIKSISNVLQNPWLLIEAMFAVLFLILGFFVNSFGKFFEFESMLTLPYLCLALLPSVLYVAVMLFFAKGTSKQKQKPNERRSNPPKNK